MKMDPKQVHMAPFGLIFIQDGSHKLWEASGMLPGFQNPTENQKIWVFCVFRYFLIFSSIFLSSLYSDMTAVGVFPLQGGPVNVVQLGGKS